ncbi:hypothetical protein M5K25_024187 [Dendrobium thyrsiflorum]|uniref:Uncharacterized protein n=1 Tax=Dendrobium thyrsiflorum TaxID=117978 RepID=A0ABD0U1R6_DENTH
MTRHNRYFFKKADDNSNCVYEHNIDDEQIGKAENIRLGGRLIDELLGTSIVLQAHHSEAIFIASFFHEDLELDHEFVYNDQGQENILKSPFFDVNLEIDHTIEEYVDRIIFSLAAAIDEQLSSIDAATTSKHQAFREKLHLFIRDLDWCIIMWFLAKVACRSTVVNLCIKEQKRQKKSEKRFGYLVCFEESRNPAEAGTVASLPAIPAEVLRARLGRCRLLALKQGGNDHFMFFFYSLQNSRNSNSPAHCQAPHPARNPFLPLPNIRAHKSLTSTSQANPSSDPCSCSRSLPKLSSLEAFVYPVPASVLVSEQHFASLVFSLPLRFPVETFRFSMLAWIYVTIPIPEHLGIDLPAWACCLAPRFPAFPCLCCCFLGACVLGCCTEICCWGLAVFPSRPVGFPIPCAVVSRELLMAETFLYIVAELWEEVELSSLEAFVYPVPASMDIIHMNGGLVFEHNARNSSNYNVNPCIMKARYYTEPPATVPIPLRSGAVSEEIIHACLDPAFASLNTTPNEALGSSLLPRDLKLSASSL